MGDVMRLRRNTWVAGAVIVLAVSSAAHAFVPLIVAGEALTAFIGRVVGARLVQSGAVASLADPKVRATLQALGTAAAGLAGSYAISQSDWWATFLKKTGFVDVETPLSNTDSSRVTLHDNSGATEMKLAGSGMGSLKPSDLPTVPSQATTILDQNPPNKEVFYYDSSATSWGNVRRFRTVRQNCGTCTSPAAPFTGPMDSTFTSTYSGPLNTSNHWWARSYYRLVATGTIDYVYEYTPATATGEKNAAPAYVSNYKPISSAVADLPDSEASQPLSDKLIAELANRIWQAVPADASTVQYSPSSPITPADVAAVRSGVSTYDQPKVGDFVSPVGSDWTRGWDKSLDSSSASTGGASGTNNGVQTINVNVDLGADPGTGQPELERIPGAIDILSPLTGLMSDLRNFSVPNHSSVCPQPSFTVLNSHYVIDSHCQMIENNRAVIEACFMAAWAILAVFIVLEA